MQLKFGIREKLLLPLLLGLVIIICVLFLFWQPSQLEKAKKQFIASQTNILKTLTPSIIQNILANDLSELHRVFENSQIIHENDWVYIQLENHDNKQLYPIFSSKPATTSTEIKINLTIEENNEIFGYLTLFTDWKETKNKELKSINQLSILTILLFCIIAIVSFFIQTKWIYIPISTLKDITSQLSSGKYKIKLPPVTTDEIGLLTNSIDRMRDKIQFTMNELVDKEKMQRAILESVPDGIITINIHGIIQSFNPGAENIFNYSENEVIGENVKVLMPDEFSSHHDNYLSDFKYVNDNHIIRPDRAVYGMQKNGHKFPIELAVNAKIIDGEYLFTGVIRDITERRKIERLKDEFISTVSHELRTPLTAIKGSLDLITKGMNLSLPEQADTMLDVANRNVERLLTLINDILDVSKLESGEINFIIKPLNLKEFITDTININQEYAKKHNTIFKCTGCHDDIWIDADKDRLVQVMSNLLSNAAKYSPADIPVEIFTEVNNDILRVNIKDYGQGIPNEFQKKLFEKFSQSDSGDTREVGGTGLGLNISKMIIEKLGGNIGYKTIEWKETTFYFELPIINSNH